MIQILQTDASQLPFPDNHFDCLVTDPPYGYGFMGKNWDKAVVGVNTWKEVLRVMKPGAFGFIMSAPRQDVLARMIVNLQEAGFETGFTSIYWAYATGFPKATNISKVVDKRLGVEREVVGSRTSAYGSDTATGERVSRDKGGAGLFVGKDPKEVPLVDGTPASPQAQTLDGAYAGFQPKPAVEVILVVMKPLSEKTYLDQAMKDGKGVTWLEAGRIPIEGADKTVLEAKNPHTVKADNAVYGDYSMCREPWEIPQGRFPANLLVSDDVLDDGRVTTSAGGAGEASPGALGKRVYGAFENIKKGVHAGGCGDTGTFSRYFDLDAWWEALPDSVRQTFPFLIVPKASKAEKNRGIEEVNHHPTVKPIKLMSYLIAIGSRPDDIILDPFMGSGTTLVAAKAMGRRAVGLDNDPECIPVAEARVKAVNRGLF